MVFCEGHQGLRQWLEDRGLCHVAQDDYGSLD